MKILIASTNFGKIQEITHLIQEMQWPDMTVVSLKDFDIPESDEPYEDFLANAKHKAQHYGKATGHITLSDDSGLCIQGLKGFPGVRTKEFVIDCGGLDKAYAKLQEMMTGITDYKAWFHAATVLYFPKTEEFLTHEAQDHGQITFPPRGPLTQGFGCDPIFIPDGYDITLSEMSFEEKNKISHRGKAIRGLMKELQQSLSQE